MSKTTTKPAKPLIKPNPRREQATHDLRRLCELNFPAPEFETVADAKGNVWVKRSGGSRSVGLSPWLLRDHSEAEVLARLRSKLEL